MDQFSFLIELNNYLGFTLNRMTSSCSGDVSGIHYVIYFSDAFTLRARTFVRLFGDDPFEDHIKSAFEKLKFFKAYSQNHDLIELEVGINECSEDIAFSICEDINSFSETLSSLGYKAAPEEKDINERLAEARDEQQAFLMSNAREVEEKRKPLPEHFLRGMLGALIGAGCGMALWMLLSFVNYMVPFLLGTLIVVILPIILYEVFSKVKTSALQIVFCLFITVIALLLGDRLTWVFTLQNWYEDITFAQAYWEVPYLIEDGIVEPMDYYQDYIAMFGMLLFVYGGIIINYIRNGRNIAELMSAMKNNG